MLFSESSPLESALEYANNNFYIFPVESLTISSDSKRLQCTCKGKCRHKDPICKGWCNKCSPGKHPATKKGFKEATKEISTIKEWWKSNKNYNIGIVPGFSEFNVIDVDPKNGGIESLSKLILEYGDMGFNNAPCVKTGSGGFHYWFKASINHPLSNSRGNLPIGIDVRGTNGYVVVPPSLHYTGEKYQWINIETLVELRKNSFVLDPIFISLIKPSFKKTSVHLSVKNKIDVGTRNNTITSLAGHYFAKGLSEKKVLSLCLNDNIKKCNPPLSITEIHTIVRSVQRYHSTKNSKEIIPPLSDFSEGGIYKGKFSIIWDNIFDSIKTCFIISNFLETHLNYYIHKNRPVIIENNEIKNVTLLKFIFDIVTNINIYKRDKENVLKLYEPSKYHFSLLFENIPNTLSKNLNGIIYHPYLDDNDELIIEPGYNSQTQLYGSWHKEDYKELSSLRVSYCECLKQIETINKELFRDVLFKEEKDRTATFVATMTAILRPQLEIAPLIHVTAPTPGSGKSFLCQLIGKFATNKDIDVNIFPKTEEEFNKTILASLYNNRSVINFDNIDKDIVAHPSFCAILTSSSFSARKLGTTSDITTTTRILFLSSGNNVNPVNDMARRTMVIELDPKCEKPLNRKFSIDPKYNLETKKTQYIIGLLKVILGWVQAGKPFKQTKGVGFEQWVKYCVQPFLWLGLKDPLEGMSTQFQDNSYNEDLFILLKTLFEKYNQYPFKIKQVVAEAMLQVNSFTTRKDLYEAIKDVIGVERDGSINKKKLGWYFKNKNGQVVRGLRIVKHPKLLDGDVLWRIEAIVETKE